MGPLAASVRRGAGNRGPAIDAGRFSALAGTVKSGIRSRRDGPVTSRTKIATPQVVFTQFRIGRGT